MSHEWEEEEEMAAERDLADDAQWKIIQKNTFTRWCNEHLKTVNRNIANLDSDFGDGLRLIALTEVLSSKKFRHVNKRPTFRTQKLENVTMCLKFLEDDEGIRIVNIDSSDIVDQKLKLILGLIWTLILHYSISMPMWEDDDDSPTTTERTPKQRLLDWIQSKVPDRPITNFTKDWNDGKAIGALVDALAPGLCPDWEDWDPAKAKDNAKEAMDAAQQWLDIPQLIKPEEMTNPNVDDLSMMTYLSQFPNAKLKPGAPLRPKTNPARVRAYGPGIEPEGNCVNAPARFTVETFSAGRGDVEVTILNPSGKQEKCEVVFNNDKNLTYSCVYTPTVAGQYKVVVKFANKEIPKSPFTVNVAEKAGDASKCWAAGPGIEKSGNTVNKKTYFEVYTKDAGSGIVDVGIVDPDGKKDTVRPTVIMRTEEVWYVEYTPKKKGLHSVNVFFAGKPIPSSPFGVGVSPASGTLDPSKLPAQPTSIKPVDAAIASIPPKKSTPMPKKVAEAELPAQLAAKKPAAKKKPVKPAFDATKAYATGRGIQPKGIRVGEDADFKVHLENAGTAELKVEVAGPGGVKEEVKIVQVETTLYECVYKPKKKKVPTATLR